MDHAATVGLCPTAHAGDVDVFGDLLADDFVEHEDLPGCPTKDEIKVFLDVHRGVPQPRIDRRGRADDRDQLVTDVGTTGTRRASSGHAGIRARPSACVLYISASPTPAAHVHWGVFDTMR